MPCLDSGQNLDLQTHQVPQHDHLTLYSIIVLFDAFEISWLVFENIMENGAFAPNEQMLHFQ